MARRAPAAHVRHRPEVLDVRRSGRQEVNRAHDAVPVPPGLGELGVLAAVHDHLEHVRAPGPEPARGHGERGVRVDVPADPAAVQDHRRVPAHAVEADQPAEPAGRGRATKLVRYRRTVPGRAPAARGSRTRSAREPAASHRPPARSGRAAFAAGRALALGLGLLWRRRLGGGGRCRLDAHLPPARQRVLRRHRALSRRGGGSPRSAMRVVTRAERRIRRSTVAIRKKEVTHGYRCG